MKIFVTGSEGFIGSHLVEKLVKKGHEVKALVMYNFRNSDGWLEDLDINVKKNIEIFKGDIKDFDLIKRQTKRCDAIIHLAALIGIPYSYYSPRSYIDTNVVGTFNILQAAKDNKISKIINTSTSEVYGSAKKIPITEKHPLQAQSPYSASKIAADQIAMSFYNSYNLPLIISVMPNNLILNPNLSAISISSNSIFSIPFIKQLFFEIFLLKARADSILTLSKASKPFKSNLGFLGSA